MSGEDLPVPDLLALDAPPGSTRVDALGVRQLLVFSFATAASVEAFDEALDSTVLPASGWDARLFARDLFLDDLVASALPVRACGRSHRASTRHLRKVLASPPADDGVRRFRAEIQAELASSPEHRASAERVYVEIMAVRAMLSATSVTATWLRRLEVLRATHRVLRTLASSFEGASSGLDRLRAFGDAVVESAGFHRLESLLDHEEHLGTVDLRVRVGADGELRRFQIVKVEENTRNPFHESAFGRFWSRLRLFLRGYRMNGGEVIERLLDDVFTGLERAVTLLLQLGADLEVHLAVLGLRDTAEARGLSMCLASFEGGAQGPMRFESLWNPLLLSPRADKRGPVPADLPTDAAEGIVVVTGPNSGGKTRLLQAIGIAALLGAGGFFTPAASARLPRLEGLFVSLVEEARADQPEGQLGMELSRIRRLFEELEPGSLVLLDELCSGTNPSEGEEIARLVLSLLPELGVQVFVTTHLLDFATRLASEQREAPPSSWAAKLEFLQVELDARDRPTYAFVRGVAKSSLAQRTAARLGVTRDELLELIVEKRRRSPAVAAEASEPPSSGVHLPAAVA